MLWPSSNWPHAVECNLRVCFEVFVQLATTIFHVLDAINADRSSCPWLSDCRIAAAVLMYSSIRHSVSPMFPAHTESSSHESVESGPDR